MEKQINFAIVAVIVAAGLSVATISQLIKIAQTGALWAIIILVVIALIATFFSGYGLALVTIAFGVNFNQRDNEKLVTMLKSILTTRENTPIIVTPEIPYEEPNDDRTVVLTPAAMMQMRELD